MEKIRKWVWQHEKYPEFDYRYEQIAPLISSVTRNTGKLEYATRILDQKDLDTVVVDSATDEIVRSSEIEGEILNRDSVRSSIRKKMGDRPAPSQDSSTRHTDELADILIDSSFNPAPLSEKRLHGWHNALFPTGYSGGYKIDVATYRSDEMRVVSQRGYGEVVHYVAPPHERVAKEMRKLLVYVNHSQEDPYIKSAIAHLWFVIIHPYDDGNGRIARNIANYILAKELGLNHYYFSLSKAIAEEKQSYYDTLERTNNLIYNRNFDFTEWVAWHVDAVDRAIKDSLLEIEKVVQKAKFWDRARNFALNERQIKVLNKMLDKGDAFEGALSTKKYAAIAKTSIPTAKRDISRLVEYGLLRQVEGTAGRNIRYEAAVIENESSAP
ncbi:Fic family protein [Nitratifractor sp.]|uniref:Fic family protein n=1 Tax=Nitratifractor sp. TaxID=2268144 RepID=UPI0025CDE33D|nr:DUF4172 domain-containing protein [Nitratifractor sp.]